MASHVLTWGVEVTMYCSKLTIHFAALVLASLLWSARPTPAHAVSFSTEATGGSFTLVGVGDGVAEVMVPITIGVSLVGGFSLGLGIADFVSYGIDSPWDDGWAVVDLVTGGLTLAGGAALFIAGIAADSPHSSTSPGSLYGLGSGLMLWGGHLIAHGIWSLVMNDRPPPVAVIPTEGGAMLQVGSAF